MCCFLRLHVNLQWSQNRKFNFFFEKDHFTSLSGPVLVRPVNSISMSPLSHYPIICCKMISLVRSNAVWNTMTMNMRVYKFMDGGFGRSFVGREGKPIFSISVHSSDNISLSFPFWMVQCNQPATRWLADPPREWCCIESLVLVSAMADWSFSSGCSQITTHRVSGSQYSWIHA